MRPFSARARTLAPATFMQPPPRLGLMPGKAKPKAKPTTKRAAKRKTKTRVKPKANRASSASKLIDQRIRSLPDWRGRRLAEVRRLIHDADPDVVEECKWVKPTNPMGVPVWSHAGILCTGEAYKDAVKLTFARGASLPDPARLFNASLEGSTRRAIDLHEGHALDADAFKALVQAAVAENVRASAWKAVRGA